MLPHAGTSRVLLRFLAALLCLVLCGTVAIAGGVHVRGYFRKNGTYVRPHTRTAPDGNPNNNYSFPGNYNPNTGKTSGGNPDTYLRNYYKRGSSYALPSSSGQQPAVQLAPQSPSSPSAPTSSIPQHAHISPLWGDRWECDHGYRQVGDGCARVSVPAHAHISALWGDRWECDRGYRLVDAGCERVSVPDHAHISALWGDRWECDRGYRNVGAHCDRVAVPEHAHISALWGDRWECDRGFRNVRDGCDRITLPEHAHISALWGDRWECDRGYRQAGMTCVPMTLQGPTVAGSGSGPPRGGWSGGGGSGGSGHDAGYQWAEDHDIDDPSDCGGNSASFIEGCEEYAEEQQAAQEEEEAAAQEDEDEE